MRLGVDLQVSAARWFCTALGAAAAAAAFAGGVCFLLAVCLFPRPGYLGLWAKLTAALNGPGWRTWFTAAKSRALNASSRFFINASRRGPAGVVGCGSHDTRLPSGGVSQHHIKDANAALETGDSVPKWMSDLRPGVVRPAPSGPP